MYNKVENKKNQVNIVFIVFRIFIIAKPRRVYNKYKLEQVPLLMDTYNVFLTKLVLLNLIHLRFITDYLNILNENVRVGHRKKIYIGKRTKKCRALSN